MINKLSTLYYKNSFNTFGKNSNHTHFNNMSNNNIGQTTKVNMNLVNFGQSYQNELSNIPPQQPRPPPMS